jgi:hypothetical protein
MTPIFRCAAFDGRGKRAAAHLPLTRRAAVNRPAPLYLVKFGIISQGFPGPAAVHASTLGQESAVKGSSKLRDVPDIDGIRDTSWKAGSRLLGFMPMGSPTAASDNRPIAQPLIKFTCKMTPGQGYSTQKNPSDT